MKFHPDKIPQSSHADDVSKILTQLWSAALEGRAIKTWADLASDVNVSGFTYKEGDSVYFVRQDENGNVYEAEFQLPKWVKTFRQALEAFSEGKSDEEVRTILEFDPIVVDRKAQREMKNLIDATRTVDDLIRVQENVRQSKTLLEQSRQKLLREIVGKIAGAYSPLLSGATKFNELTSLSQDVRKLIDDASIAAKEDKDYFLGVLSMIIDSRAEMIGSTILESEEGTELEKIAGFITAISAFPFKDQVKKEALIGQGNELAHSTFMENMKRARSEKGLERLHEYAYRFPFSLDDEGERVRNDILQWIEKKWYSYFSPEAREAQNNMVH